MDVMIRLDTINSFCGDALLYPLAASLGKGDIRCMRVIRNAAKDLRSNDTVLSARPFAALRVTCVEAHRASP
jgi:hypothetical protein